MRRRKISIKPKRKHTSPIDDTTKRITTEIVPMDTVIQIETALAKIVLRHDVLSVKKKVAVRGSTQKKNKKSLKLSSRNA